MQNQLRVLCLDIETTPCEVYSWGLGEQHHTLDFLKRDYTICAWAAHWVGKPADEVMYEDTRGQRDIFNDKRIVKNLIKLINKADVIIGQNVKSFDIRKVAARADFHKLPPFRPVPVTDILTEERRVFALTSHKLAHKTQRNKTYKKLEHKEYPGFGLWLGVMADDLKAWKSMEEYCKYDVLSTEERYLSVRGWIRTYALGPADGVTRCKCGSTNLKRKGYAMTDAGKFQIFLCRDCKKWPRSSINLLTKGQKSARLRESQ
jgi:hypothetical protein